MPVAINKTELASYLISKAVENQGGLKIDPKAAIENQEDGEGNVISTIWNWGKALFGFVVGAAKGLFKTFNFSALVSNFIQGVRFVLSFDFGQDDKSIDNQIKGIWNAWKLQAAGSLGNATGWFVCGGIANGLIFVFNPVAAAETLKESGEEAFEELIFSLGAMTRLTVQGAAKTAALNAFKNVRRWLKEPNNPIYPILPESLKEAWQKNKPWTLGAAINRRIISWFPPSWKDLVEEFMEEALDACQEALMVVASSLDRFVAERRAGILGGETVLEVTPNRSEPNEKYLLAGPQELVRSQVVQSLTSRRWLQDKDLGIVFNADKQDEFIKAEPEGLFGYITYRFEDKSITTRPSVKISAINQAKLNFADIRTAADPTGYLYGPYVAVARMRNGRRIKCFAASEPLAAERVKKLAVLSTAEIATIDVTHEQNEFDRITRNYLKKPSAKVFPWRFVLINRKYFTEPIPGATPSKRGNYLERKWIFDISTAEKPWDWDARIAEILVGPTPANP